MIFYKYHGIGNDFILIDCINEPVKFTDFSSKMIIQLCHRHFGIGADGVLFVMTGKNGNNYRMRLLNSDGSEGQMCGNGIRCVAKHIYDKIERKQKLAIETLAGLIIVDMKNALAGQISVNMGKPIFLAEKIPTIAGIDDRNRCRFPDADLPFEFYIVSTGVPHCVIFVEDLTLVNIKDVAPRIEKHSYFPEGTNVNFVQVIAYNCLKAVVWERGAGFTMACGTGACASLVCGVLAGLVQKDVEVILPGGTLNISWEEDETVKMHGDAKLSFHGEFLNSDYQTI